MNDFLEKIWLDNPVKNYLIVTGVIVFVILLKKMISRNLANLLFRLVHKIWKDVDKRSFASLLIQPLGFFLLILVSIIALHKLVFPAQLNIDIYGYSVKEIVHCIATSILIVSFVWMLLRIIDFIATILERKAELTPDQSDNQLIVFFRDFLKIVIAIVGVMMVLNYALGLNVNSLVTGLSIVGAAIALALRESIENLIASFIIFFDKPFTLGDIVKVHNLTGTVEKIGLRSTRIRSEQKTYVSVPNKQMVDSIVDNLTLRTQRRADLKLELKLTTPSSKLQTLIDSVKKIMERPEIEDVNVYFSDISTNAFILQSDYYISPVTLKEFNAIRQEINMQVLKLVEELQIEIEGTNRDVRIVNNGG
jgi:MscS family membrane protein